MANKKHIEWLREGAAGWNERRNSTPFTPDLSGADLQAILTKVEERHFKVTYPLPPSAFQRDLLNEIDFWGIDLSEADLRGSNFSYLSFPAAKFDNANLSNAFFAYATLSASSFTKADLSQTNFDCALMDHCDLRGTIFNDTYVRGANLFKANVSSLSPPLDDHIPTDIRGMKYLYPNQLNDLVGDRLTKIHSRFERPLSWQETDNNDNVQTALSTPLVNAASFDFEIDQRGVTAKLPISHQAHRSELGEGCLNRSDALIANALSIANAVSNKLGEDTRGDLLAYADHLTETDPANPHRLSFLAKGIAADLNDPLVSAGFNQRLVVQIRDFLNQHQDFLSECIPAAAEAIATKDAIEPNRVVSKEEATEVLDKLEAAIIQAEAATDSYLEAIQGLRDYDDELNQFKLRVFSPADQEKLDQLVKRETVELASFGSRLYWRAKEVVARVRLHAGDIAIAASTTGKTAPEMALAIVEFLQPLISKLQEIITVLPPV